MKVPGYISLLCELVATLESMDYQLPDGDVKKSISQRCDQLKRIGMNDINVRNEKLRQHISGIFSEYIACVITKEQAVACIIKQITEYQQL